MLRFGYKAATEQFGPQELLEYVRLAEQVGFDSIWASDHFHPWMPEGEAIHVWSWLGALGAKTSTISLGTEVTAPILRYNPAIIAQAVGTLGVLYPGRVFLGLGTGEALNEYPTTGKWPAYQERHDMLKEAVEIIRKLLMEDYVTYEGKYFHLRDAKLFTKPSGGIPIYLAAGGPESTELAGELGDGFITTSKPEQFEQKLKDALLKGLQRAGKDIKSFPIIGEIPLAYSTAEAVLPDIRKYWGSLSLEKETHDPKKLGNLKEREKWTRGIGDEQLLKAYFISTDPEEHVEKLKSYIQAGFTTLVFRSPQRDQKQFIINYGRYVLPALQKEFA